MKMQVLWFNTAVISPKDIIQKINHNTHTFWSAFKKMRANYCLNGTYEAES